MIIHCAYDKLIPIEGLRPHPKNPNKHSEDQILRLAKIIEYQGIRRAVRVSRLSGYITAGHGLVLAARHLKSTEVPVNFQDYENEDQEYADIIADNAIASWASLDLSSVNLELSNLGPDFNIEMLGLKDFELEPADKYANKEIDLLAEKLAKARFIDDYGFTPEIEDELYPQYLSYLNFEKSMKAPHGRIPEFKNV